ncbi:hypothetical protein AAZX31_10G173200 [Glycine max]|uniref:Embryo sac development arrest 6 n=2 Tax=Glycine subgen. Soja TaxID=1462606 RepID=I1LC85_SOYBN|nr:uncharacterized protein LOC100788942 [Glycine max]XP_028183830.1 uncharacterized protein LOC114370637 [Glycine soja]KAG4983706.1 hypothetical protein JHK87_028455 [Glycine soja]KAG5004529.1 hypothetical protein JHK86_028668 [Glycine max]KAG5127709.1 hypothetical protein JHK82_028544 [Glycine max]KAH1138926.1 hypothetical protein GYH30_028391 [Glycine max]KAH1230059.1 hypothetical protein GmHk_10G029636 [Glycine max]|eukprot:XP_003535434.1 uncharacterized protein LOC100788942 [Glycine max]
MMSQHSRRRLPRGNPRKAKRDEVDKQAAPKAAEPAPSSNRLLAGYLAHEFLTRGTLLGQKFELDLDRAGLAGSSSAEASAVEARPCVVKEHHSYEVLANLLKRKETHIKGIVNPTQLSNWINK